MPEFKVRELTVAEKACLGCTLFAPVCNGTDKGCRYIEITRTPKVGGRNLVDWHSPESRAKAAAKTSDTLRTAAGWVRDANGEWMAKPCSACREVKPLEAFYKSGKAFAAKCRTCWRSSALSKKGTSRQEVVALVRESREQTA